MLKSFHILVLIIIIIFINKSYGNESTVKFDNCDNSDGIINPKSLLVSENEVYPGDSFTINLTITTRDTIDCSTYSIGVALEKGGLKIGTSVANFCDSINASPYNAILPGTYQMVVELPTPSELVGDIYQCKVRVGQDLDTPQEYLGMCIRFDEYLNRGFPDYFAAIVAFVIAAAASWHLGKAFPTIRLPLITGYLAIGIIVGPFVCDLVTSFHIYLIGRAINDFALSFISFAAGEEIYFPSLDGLLTPIFRQIFLIFTVTMTLVPCGFLSVDSLSDTFSSLGAECQIGVSLLLGIVMVARSPASAVAVVQEFGNENVEITSTKMLLGITVMSDFVVLIGFAIICAIVAILCPQGDSNEQLNASALFFLLGQFLGIALFGYAVGALIYLVLSIPMKRYEVRTIVIYRSYLLGMLILPLGPLTFNFLRYVETWSASKLGNTITIDPLMVCLLGATYAANKSDRRAKFGNILHKCGPYVFLPFFTLTGASLKLNLLWKTLPLASFICILRVFSIFFSSSILGRVFTRDLIREEHLRYLWMTLLSQAGVALGLAMEVVGRFKDSKWPADFQTLILAIVVLNQIIGPPMCKLGISLLSGTALPDTPISASNPSPRFLFDETDMEEVLHTSPGDGRRPTLTRLISHAYQAVGSQRRLLAFSEAEPELNDTHHGEAGEDHNIDH